MMGVFKQLLLLTIEDGWYVYSSPAPVVSLDPDADGDGGGDATQMPGAALCFNTASQSSSSSSFPTAASIISTGLRKGS